MAGTTPKGRYRSYSYYQTLTKSNGEHRRVSCDTVDTQIPEWLKGIQVAPDSLPKIRELYQEHIASLKGPDVNERLAELNSLIERLHDEEAAIARLYAQRQLTEQNYGRLHREWQTKLFEAEQSVHKLQSSIDTYIDDLDAALMLLAKAQMLYEKLPIEKQARLLQILCRRIIIDGHGKIVDFELNPPFMYLHRLKSGPVNGDFHERQGSGLEQLLYSPPDLTPLD